LTCAEPIAAVVLTVEKKGRAKGTSSVDGAESTRRALHADPTPSAGLTALLLAQPKIGSGHADGRPKTVHVHHSGRCLVDMSQSRTVTMSFDLVDARHERDPRAVVAAPRHARHVTV
jgi:hypothetical protein